MLEKIDSAVGPDSSGLAASARSCHDRVQPRPPVPTRAHTSHHIDPHHVPFEQIQRCFTFVCPAGVSPEARALSSNGKDWRSKASTVRVAPNAQDTGKYVYDITWILSL
jgi:hypothetical protein